MPIPAAGPVWPWMYDRLGAETYGQRGAKRPEKVPDILQLGVHEFTRFTQLGWRSLPIYLPFEWLRLGGGAFAAPKAPVTLVTCRSA